MSTRQGGKLKPLKVCLSWTVSINDLNVIQAPKKAKAEDDEDTKAFKEKQKADAAARAAAKDRGACCCFLRFRQVEAEFSCLLQH